MYWEASDLLFSMFESFFDSGPGRVSLLPQKAVGAKQALQMRRRSGQTETQPEGQILDQLPLPRWKAATRTG